MPIAMNTSQKTTPVCSNKRGAEFRAPGGASLPGVLAAALAAAVLSVASAAAAAPALRCSLQVPAAAQAGSPVMLQMKLSNTGAQTLHVLRWNTPFEGVWLGESVTLWRKGRQLPYRGPSVKRAAPSAPDYSEIAPGATREASLDLGLVFDLTRAGAYELRPQFWLHDVQSGPLTAAPESPHVAMALHCPTLRFKLGAKL
jgi:hypothetical protein